jgi:hypothetical protein
VGYIAVGIDTVLLAQATRALAASFGAKGLPPAAR